ncbi:MAG TPA: molybdopterin molybdotransferase MoeA [Opitutaceae bacterium]|jgi:molybdopterin molybdotransferase|nr:molybdopterin molybdotransferase MoeA [Opitutaceae bacterium]
MLTPAEAEKLILAAMPLWHREDCPIAAAHGRVLRLDLRADRDLPPFDRVTLDGYALRSASVAAGTIRFRVEAVQAAGMRPFVLGPEADACIEIMTGAALPAGADCVVPYEEVRRDGAAVTLTQAVAADRAVHRRGSDHRAGEVVVPAGTRLTGREIAVAAACGYGTLTVSRRPKVAVVASGDELVEVSGSVAPHQIRRSNDYALRAALEQAGFPGAERFHLRDMQPEIEHLLWHVLAEYDVVLLTGGISKGKFDFLPAELDRQGVRKVFQGVAQRPGKPFWFGVSGRQKPVFALPGNPVSAYTCLHRYVLPALDQAGGLAPRRRERAILASAVPAVPGLARLLPVRLAEGAGAERRMEPCPGNTSGDFAGLVGTDGFVELPAGPAEFPAGFAADYWPWT